MREGGMERWEWMKKEGHIAVFFFWEWMRVEEYMAVLFVYLF